jgi:beta-galactosidase GanA
MSSVYVAFFANPALLDDLGHVDWESYEEVREFLERINAQGYSRVWGNSTDGWVLSAITDWLLDKFPELLPKLANDLVPDCQYFHWVVGPADRPAVSAILAGIDPRNDPTFVPNIAEYFEALGADYVEGYVEEGFDCYYETFEDLRDDLDGHPGETLVIIIAS